MKSKLMALFLFVGIYMRTAQQTDPYFEAVDLFLKTYVDKGKVDYKAIKASPSGLNELLEMAKDINVSSANVDVYQAFWINTYNLMVINGIVAHYPLNSPLDIDGFFDKKLYEVGGRTITLNGIENELLRAQFPNEPRFHFVLVCAGLGCPPIINEAYRPKTLDSQLHLQTKKALNDPTFIKVEGETVLVSQIFEWYQNDFKKVGGVTAFINTYRIPKLPYGAKIGFYPYNWALNSKN